ncbi:uncharacterized protein METZ01_LOCUS311898, partial [marine metagenome]
MKQLITQQIPRLFDGNLRVQPVMKKQAHHRPEQK